MDRYEILYTDVPSGGGFMIPAYSSKFAPDDEFLAYERRTRPFGLGDISEPNIEMTNVRGEKW